MATNLVYSNPDFLPFTKIVSADVNAKFNDIKNRFNWDGTTATTGLADDNVQSNTVSGGGLTRASKLKATTANFVLINDNTGKMSEEAQLAVTRGGLGFNPTLSGNAGKAIVVKDDETALELGSPQQSTITQSFAGDIATLTAGEAITLNDAVCLDLHSGSGTPEYRVFKCDSDLPNRRRNFLGFALEDATVTPNILTWTDDADLVTSNVIDWSINGRSYSQNFDTDNDTTLAAIATQIASDPDVASAVVTNAGSNDRVITITSIGGLFLNIPTPSVTGGASQANVTIAQTQAASGQNVRIRNFGEMLGMSGLTPGLFYYLSSSSGLITATPTDSNPIKVGQALSSTVLFVNQDFANYNFSTPVIMVRSHGGSTGITPANFQSDVEHFNFVSWASGTSDVNARGRLQCGESTLGGYHIVVDGVNTSTAVSGLTRLYNKSAWASSGANRTSPRQGGGVVTIANNLYVGEGSTDTSYTGGVGKIEKFNGTTWTNLSNFSSGDFSSPTCFFQGGLGHWVAGVTAAGSGLDNHNTHDGVSEGSDTVFPVAIPGEAGSVSAGSNAIGHRYDGSASYVWSGSAWGSVLSVGYTTSGESTVNTGAAGGYNSGSNMAYLNGGSSASTTSVNTTARFNGTSFTSDTSSTLARAGAAGSVF